MKKIFRNLMAIAIAAVAFTACEDVPEPYYVFGEEDPSDNPGAIVAEGSGTQADPYNVAGVLAFVQTLGTTESSEAVYVKGIVAAITEIGTSYGNATYTISDDGTTDNVFTVYRGKNLGNTNFTADDLAVGDEVVVYGKVINYNGRTPEFVQNGSYLYSRNGQTTAGGGSTDQPAGEAKGDGSLNNPYNAVAAANLAKSLTSGNSDNVYIKGKVVSIKENFTTQYGNATFYISDDGTEAGQFYVFCTLYLGNKKYESGDLLKQGDEVVIYGKVTNYQGNTPETVQNESFIYSLNGKTEGGNDNPNPQPTNESSKDNPFTVAKALEVARALSSSETVANEYVKGVVVQFVSFDAGYHNSRYYIADTPDATEHLYIFDGKGLDNADLNSAEDIKEGDEVIVFGTLSNYQGNTPEMNRGNYLVYHNGNGGGNDNPNPQPGGGEISGNTITANFSAFGLENEADLIELTLADGTTLTFAQNDGRNVPKYYNNGTNARLYALNSMTINAQKNIQKVVINCAKNYNGNETLTASAAGGSVQIERAEESLTFSGFSAPNLVITNDHTSASGGTQLRMTSIVITYAE